MDYVFNTDNCKRYRFPTHSNDLVVDRSDSSFSEVIIVGVEPGKATHVHHHDHVEQIFYITEGEGILRIGIDKKEISLKPGHIVRIPPHTPHSVLAVGEKELKYICIDCFNSQAKMEEPTWDAHVKAICKEQGYDYDTIVTND